MSRSAERSKRYFHRRGRNGKQHLQRRFLRKRGAAGIPLPSSPAAMPPAPHSVATRHLSPAGESLSKGTAKLPQSKPDGFASSLWEGAFGMAVQFPAKPQSLRACPLPLGGAVAQRLRGYKSAEPEKTVKRSSRRTGVNLQFFPVGAHFFRIVKGEQPLTRCGVGGVQR